MSITRTLAGLLLEDDFNRADADDPGGDWVPRSGNWPIRDDRVRVWDSTSGRVMENVAAEVGEMFVQTILRTQDNAWCGIFARFDWNGGSFNGYLFQPIPLANAVSIQRASGGSFTVLVNTGQPLNNDTDYPTQFYVADGVQEGWINGVSHSSDDDAHDGQNNRHMGYRAQRQGGTPQRHFDDAIWCRTNKIIVTGLSTGQKAKVRNGSGTVIAQATESGGTATINVSRYEEEQSAGTGATEDIPIGGWADLVVTDSEDTILETYDATGVYPGDEYTLGAPLEITTTSLPGATVGEPYSETLQATGGEPPYTWSIVSGSLPSGLSLTAATGEISGTPDTAETANFTAQVTDDTSATDTQALSIEVETSDAPELVSATTNAAGTEIRLTFDGAMADPSGEHAAFSFEEDEVGRSFSAAALAGGDPTTIVLTVDGAAIESGTTVTVSYDAGAGSVESDAGTALDSFDDSPVTNAVTFVALTALGVEYVFELAVPGKPTIEAAPGPGSLILTTPSGYVMEPDGPEHGATQWQVTLTTDPSFSSPVENFTLTTEPGLLSVNVDTLDGETTYLSRARHQTEHGIWSEWSDAVEETTLEILPTFDKPEVTVDEVGLDYVFAHGSEPSHPLGVTTAEEFQPAAFEGDPDANELPYLLSVRWQVQTAGGDWNEDLVFDSASDGAPLADLNFFLEALEPDTSYEIRVLYTDGYLGNDSPWSDPKPFTTDPVPPIRPVKPTININTCGPSELDPVILQSGGFGPPPEDPGATHAATQWRVCGTPTGACQSWVRTNPEELYEFYISHVPPGPFWFSVRHRDSEGRWSEWSDLGDCTAHEIPRDPEWVAPTSGVSISGSIIMEWAPPAVDAGGSWQFHIEVSSDRGLTWEEWLPWSSDTAQVFEVGGKDDGTYFFRLRGRDSAAGVASLGVYLVLHLDRTGSLHYTVHARDLNKLRPEWQVLWNGHPELDPKAHEISWELVNRNLQTKEEFDPETDPAYAIRAVNHGTFTNRHSVLAFTELGEVDTGKFTIELALAGLECQWYFWRWAHTTYLNGGFGYRILGGPGIPANGYMNVINSGNQPWPITGRRCLSGTDTCPCKCLNCSQCESVAAQLWAIKTDDERMVRYGVPVRQAGWWSRGHPGPGTAFWYLGVGNAIPYEGHLRRGANVSQRFPGSGPAGCEWHHWLYTMYIEITKGVENPDARRIKMKVLGPGFDPTVEWHHDSGERTELTQLTQCGFVGLCLAHYQTNLNSGLGVLFRSFSATEIEYNECEEPEEPPIPPPHEDPFPCVVGRHFYLGLAGDENPRRYEGGP